MSKIALYFIGFIFILGCQSRSSYDNAEIISINDDTIQLVGMEDLKLEIGDSTKVFYLVRHAEKDTAQTSDPNLSELGVKRTDFLEEMFKKTRIDKVYSTMFIRTIYTASSVASKKGLSSQVYDPKQLETFAEELKANTRDRRFFIVGHSNTTPELARIISGDKTIKDIADSEYDRIFVILTNPNQNNKVYSLRYFKQL